MYQVLARSSGGKKVRDVRVLVQFVHHFGEKVELFMDLNRVIGHTICQKR
jgi:hypothetical protein